MSTQATINFSIQFVNNGLPLHSLTEEQPHKIFCDAINHANKELEKEDIVVVLKNQVPEKPITSTVDYNRNILLGIKKGETETLIDIIDLKALDEKSIKPLEALSEEIVQKVRQHLLAQKTEGIVFSSSGSKFDTRKLINHTFTIDKDRYARVDSKRIIAPTNNGYCVIKAENFRSYTILRLIEEDTKIRMFDDYDLVRHNNRGMFIDTAKVNQVAIPELKEESRKDAENYESEYVTIGRDELTTEAKKRLYEILRTFPSP